MQEKGALQGRTIVITGATSGIGLAAAEALALKGARLVLVGRGPERGLPAIARIRVARPEAAVEAVYGDLSRLSEVRRVAGEIAAKAPRIDVLVNNAGAFFQQHALTEDGLERTFALNHMSYFLLTRLLLPQIEAAAPARIVVVASTAHRGATLDFADLEGKGAKAGWTAYRRSKLANILFARELARRLEGSRVTVNALHPGFVASRFGDEGGFPSGTIIRIAKRFLAITPEEGARRIVQLASDPAVAGTTGLYFSDLRETEPDPPARDAAAAARLWEASSRIAGLPA